MCAADDDATFAGHFNTGRGQHRFTRSDEVLSSCGSRLGERMVKFGFCCGDDVEIEIKRRKSKLCRSVRLIRLTSVGTTVPFRCVSHDEQQLHFWCDEQRQLMNFSHRARARVCKRVIKLTLKDVTEMTRIIWKWRKWKWSSFVYGFGIESTCCLLVLFVKRRRWRWQWQPNRNDPSFHSEIISMHYLVLYLVNL